MQIWKIWLCAAALAFGLPGASVDAQAQDFPNRAITLVIPFAPGGSTSIVGRVIADKMSELLGEKVVVDNRPGAGTASHITGEYFARSAGIALVHIPYKGTGPALTDLLGGHIPMAFAPIPASHANVSAGTLRALAVTSTTRSNLLPDVPTMVEAGLPGFDASLYYGLVAPAGTPRPVIDKLNKTLQAALVSDEVKKQLGLDGTEITPGTPEDYAAFIDKDEKKWLELVKASGVEQE